MARPARAVRPDHAAPPHDAHLGPGDRHRGCADPARCAVARCARCRPRRRPGARFWYSNDGVEDRRAPASSTSPARRSTTCSWNASSARSACVDVGGLASRTRRRQDLAVGLRADAVGPARHSCAIRWSPATCVVIEHRRRLDRVERRRHGRLRPAAAGARRRRPTAAAAASCRRPCSTCSPTTGSTTATVAATPTACGRKRSAGTGC